MRNLLISPGPRHPVKLVEPDDLTGPKTTVRDGELADFVEQETLSGTGGTFSIHCARDICWSFWNLKNR